jgi:prophage maintenance system killer protein
MVDGNKRTGWLLFLSFIAANGVQHDMTTEQSFVLTIGIADGSLELEAAAKIIQEHLVPRR